MTSNIRERYIQYVAKKKLSLVTLEINIGIQKDS